MERKAEKSWLRFGEEVGVCVHVFRLRGIYGPGRSALDTVCVSEKRTSQQLQEQSGSRQEFTLQIPAK